MVWYDKGGNGRRIDQLIYIIIEREKYNQSNLWWLFIEFTEKRLLINKVHQE